MKLIIHRGTHTIGGSCIEISSGTHRIILDLGMPLMARDGLELNQDAIKNPSIENGILPNVDGLYEGKPPSVTAAILSHPHLDHYGLMDWIHPEIPIYLSEESRTLIEVGNIFHPPECVQKKLLDHCRTFKHWASFNIGPFTITSYLMDHSAFGASSLLIEAEGKRVFYTGDIRGHGRKGKLFRYLVKKPVPDVDCLLMEGTTLGGTHDVGCHSEKEVEEKLCKVFSEQKDVSFIMAAGSNIDQLVSIYRAAKKARKTLVLDLYQFHLLQKLREYSQGIPPHPNDGMRILYLPSHANSIVEGLGRGVLAEYKSRQIKIEEILERRQELVLRIPLSAMTWIAGEMQKSRPLSGANFIYSMWTGYLERDPKYQQFCEDYQLSMTKIHTSGHAYLHDLKRLVGALNPKAVVPIHTLAGDEFEKHFADKGKGIAVFRIDDGEPFEISSTYGRR